MAESDPRIAAYQQVFGSAEATTMVLDDLTAKARSLPSSEQQAGACLLLLHILSMRTASRKEPKKPAKGKLRTGGEAE